MGTTRETTTFFPRNMPLDDGLEAVAGLGDTFPVRLRRMSVHTLVEFGRGYTRVINPESDKYLARKADDQAEQEERDNRYVIGEFEIRRRRLAEMTAEQRAEYDKVVEADNAFVLEFSREQVAKHVWLAPGDVLQVTRDDNSAIVVTDGPSLAEAYKDDIRTLIWLVRALYQENTLSSAAKKALRSLSGSTASSPTPADVRAQAGVTPAATATPAGTAASAPSDGASADPAPTPSGSDESVTRS